MNRQVVDPFIAIFFLIMGKRPPCPSAFEPGQEFFTEGPKEINRGSTLK
jgi:hypothetical protein